MRFKMNVQCTACMGKGERQTEIHAEDIMLMILHNVKDGIVQKIPAISQVRNEYGMGLKQAKELVEGAMEFYSTIQKHASEIPNPEDARREYEERWGTDS